MWPGLGGTAPGSGARTPHLVLFLFNVRIRRQLQAQERRYAPLQKKHLGRAPKARCDQPREKASSLLHRNVCELVVVLVRAIFCAKVTERATSRFAVLDNAPCRMCLCSTFHNTFSHAQTCLMLCASQSPARTHHSGKKPGTGAAT